MQKFNTDELVIYDRGLLAETAGYKRYIDARVTMCMGESYWIEWHEAIKGKHRRRSAQVSGQKLRSRSSQVSETSATE